MINNCWNKYWKKQTRNEKLKHVYWHMKNWTYLIIILAIIVPWVEMMDEFMRIEYNWTFYNMWATRKVHFVIINIVFNLIHGYTLYFHNPSKHISPTFLRSWSIRFTFSRRSLTIVTYNVIQLYVSVFVGI